MVYDLALLEQLNNEYRDRPIIARAKPRDGGAPRPSSPPAAGQPMLPRAERQEQSALNRLKPILNDIDVTGKAVLELGCGDGWLTAMLPKHAGASRAIGVDADGYSSWPEHTDPRLRLVAADLSRQQVVPPGSIDTIISNTTFHGVARPLQTLASIYDILKEGGEAWLRTNIYTARNASHRYKDIFFPWPHLLFEDEVGQQFYQKHYQKFGPSFSWVNRMTVAHYVHVAREVGFDVTLVRRRVAPIDVEFYLRFIDKLGRYPALDLETDFLTLILAKPDPAASKAASQSLDINYTARQVELDRRIQQFRTEDTTESPGPQSASARSSPPRPDPTTAGTDIEPASPATASHNINTPGYWDNRYQQEWESGQVLTAQYVRDYGPVHDAIISLIPEDACVLDVACGSGVLCRKIKKRMPDTTVTGVDFSGYTIEQNRQVAQHPGEHYLCLNVQTDLPALRREFDVVVMAEIIEHLDDPVRAIDDAVQLLPSGGLLIITCPHDGAIPSKEHVREWGHDELFHLLATYSDTVCFTRFAAPHDKWMMTHLIKP